METKRAKVIMLPTTDNTLIKYNSSLNIISSDITNFAVDNNKHISYQHLYITTNDEIKEGWVIDNDNELKYISSSVINTKTGIARHLDDSPFILDGCKKIIATTDKSLTINQFDNKFNNAFTSAVGNDKYLPQPSQAFIEKYCKVGGIDEVLVEYIDCYDVKYKYIQGFGETAERIELPNKLKLDSHNTITIHPIKDSWTREEVIKLLHKCCRDMSSTDWIKENL